MTPTPEDLARTAATAVPDVVLLLDGVGSSLVCVYASESARSVLGRAPAELVGQPMVDLVAGDDVGLLHQLVGADLDRPTTAWLRLREAGGGAVWCECSLALAQARPDGSRLLVASLREASRKSAGPLHDGETWYDPLTGMANRSLLADRTRHALSRLGRTSKHVALLFLDLDRFKSVNDSLGHAAGDELLVSVSERLLLALRPSDTLARLGGDEFVVLAEDLVDEDDAQQLAVRLTEAGRTPFVIGGQSVSCTISTGVAVTSDPAATLDSLLQAADLAMYRAKERGRDRVEAFDEGLRSVARQRLSRERLLHGALEEGRLRVEYQPVVDLQRGQLCAVEALVRIRTDAEHLLLPRYFLSAARANGLMQRVDAWVLQRTVEQGRSWSADLPGLPVSHNITAADLAAPSFADDLMDLLESGGVAANTVHLELTEHTLMEASRSALEELRALRQAGVKVGLDDFGTGYSSLAYLRDFPLDFVKVDRSFITELADVRARRIVAAVIEMCHALDLSVVAEGVEHEHEREVLLALGCERAQGFLWARSGDGEAVRRYAQEHGVSDGVAAGR